MLLHWWNQRAKGRTVLDLEARRAAARKGLPRFRPRLEALEDRTLLSLNFQSALNLDTYAWVREHSGDGLLPRDPLDISRNDDPQVTLQYNWNQGRSPDAVALGDFNGDGNTDIAVADFNALALGKISVFLGNSNGDGSFAHTQPVVDLTTSPQMIQLLDSGGIAPVGLVAARLRGSSAPVDLIVVNRGDDFGVGANVSVLLGKGDGNFDAPQSFDAGPFPTALAVGDFNGDGNLDVVVANRTVFPGRATVLFGDGKGGFSSSVSVGLFDVSELPESVAVGDFGNGHLDFVVANASSNNVTVVLGNGDGTFGSATIYATDATPVGVAVADLDGDGKLDIVTANNGGNDVSILFGNGDGTFDPTQTVNFPAGLTPTSIVVGNFDGNGNGLAVTNGQDSSANGNTVTVLPFNKGHGSRTDLLSSPSIFRAGETPVAIAAAPLRASMPNVTDLVVANFGSTLDRGSLSVFLNDSHAVFPTPGSFATGLQPDSVAVGDFNGDGVPDFVTANAGSGDLSVWLNDKSDSRGPGFNFVSLTDNSGNAITLNTLGIDPKKVIVGDFNNDGHPDIAVADFGDFGAVPGNVTVFINTGDPNHPFSNDPQFVLQPTTSDTAYQNTYVLDMAAGEFNGDGNLDVALLLFKADALTNPFRIAVLFGDGKGNLSPQAGKDNTLLPDGTNPTAIAVADFNGDGKADIAVTNFQDNANDDTLGVLFGSGDGKFGSLASYRAGTHVSSIAVASLRGDGRTDIVVTNENFPGGVTVFLNDGNGSFSKSNTYFAGTNPASILVQDLNGDGIPDIAVANLNGDSVTVRFGHPDSGDSSHGDGTFTDSVAYVTGGLPVSIAAGDFFNHMDGRLDLVTADNASNDVSVLENIGPAPGSGGGAAAPRLGPQSASGDLVPFSVADWFMVRGVTDQEIAAVVEHAHARARPDQWHPAIHRPRMEDKGLFADLWKER
jgi:hypothetical protein